MTAALVAEAFGGKEDKWYLTIALRFLVVWVVVELEERGEDPIKLNT